MLESHLTSSHRSTEIFSPNLSTQPLLALKMQLNLNLLAKKWDTSILTVNHAVLYHLICKFLDLIEKNSIHKMFLSNLLRMAKLVMCNYMIFSKSLETSRVWKFQSMKITLQEDMDSYVIRTLNQQKMRFNKNQMNSMYVNSSQKTQKNHKENLSTTFTSKTFPMTGVMLKSRKCLTLLEISSPASFNLTKSENLHLFAMTIQLVKNMDLNVPKKQLML